MSYKAALFDLDGTLLNTLDDLFVAINQALVEEQLPKCTKSEVRQALGNGYVSLVAQLVSKDTDDVKKEAVLARFQSIYQAHSENLTAPYPGIVKALDALKAKGIKLAVISNKKDMAVQKLVPNYFPDTFDLVIGESAHMKRKPAPDMLNFAVQQLGIDKASAIYIGDSEVDVNSAKAAAMDILAVSWGFRDKNELYQTGVKTIVDTAEEMLSYIL